MQAIVAALLFLLTLVSLWPAVSANTTTIYDIYQNEDIIHIKQHFLGPRLHLKPNHHHKVIIKCEPLFDMLEVTNESAVVWPPLTWANVTSEQVASFTLDGLVRVKEWYGYLQQNGNEKPYNWTTKVIDYYANKPNTCGDFYNVPVCNDTMHKYKEYIQGKDGMVIGTMDPWAEAHLIKLGANHVTTVEYHRIVTDHPKLSSLHPSELKKDHDSGKLYDFVFTFSSLEHDGLGKWGDPISPYADLEDFARVHCMLKEGGIFFLGIPVGPDEVVWNAHRIYGKYRLAIVLKNWKLIDLVGPQPFDKINGEWGDQPIIVLQKVSSMMEH